MDERISEHPVSQVISDLTLLITSRIQQGKEVHIGLTGGTSGNEISLSLSSNTDVMASPLVHLWWSDERFLPAGDPQRNDTAFDGADVANHHRRANIHCVASADSQTTVHQAAIQYSAQLHNFTTTRFCATNTLMDVTVLSIGTDGHVASLFPHSPELHSSLGIVGITDSPKPPPQRVTWTYPTINASEQVWLIAVGQSKSEAVRQLRSGATPEDIPAAGASGKVETRLYTDLI